MAWSCPITYSSRNCVDLLRLGQLVELQLGGLGELLLDDLVAEVDALVADVHAGAGDELLDLLLALPAERALQQVRIAELRHRAASLLDEPSDRALSGPGRVGCYAPFELAAASSAVIPRLVMISSTTPYSLASSAVRMKSRSVSLRDLLERLARVLAISSLEQLAVARDLLGLDLDVDRLALRAAVRLVQQDAGVRQRVALALGARRAAGPPRPRPPGPSRSSTRRA